MLKFRRGINSPFIKYRCLRLTQRMIVNTEDTNAVGQAAHVLCLLSGFSISCATERGYNRVSHFSGPGEA